MLAVGHQHLHKPGCVWWGGGGDGLGEGPTLAWGRFLLKPISQVNRLRQCFALSRMTTTTTKELWPPPCACPLSPPTTLLAAPSLPRGAGGTSEALGDVDAVAVDTESRRWGGGGERERGWLPPAACLYSAPGSRAPPLSPPGVCVGVPTSTHCTSVFPEPPAILCSVLSTYCVLRLGWAPCGGGAGDRIADGRRRRRVDLETVPPPPKALGCGGGEGVPSKVEGC